MKRICVIAGALCLLAACAPKGLREGSLVLSFLDEVATAKTILPSLDMSTASYQVTGSGPGGRSFDVTAAVSQTLVQVPSLVPGAWDLVVYARNVGGGTIGLGTAEVQIVAGQVTTQVIKVTPLAGTGTLDITVQWPAGVLASPVLDATLAPSGGTPGAISWTPAGDGLSAQYLASLDSGYYTLGIRLTDGGEVLWGVVEGARVVTGQTSTRVYRLEKDVNRGGLAVTVDSQMDNPIDIAFTGIRETVVRNGTNMTVTATTSEPVDAYQWFLQGQPIADATAATVEVSSALNLGTYWLSLVVAKGSVVSSAQAVFDVVADGAAVTVNPTSGLVTSEAGGTATFTVVLGLAPLADVTMGLSSSDSTEGTVLPATLTFGPANWSSVQTVTVTGVDDAVKDGDQSYRIITAAATSADPSYNGLNPADVFVVNTDNEAAGPVLPAPQPPGAVIPTQTGMMAKGSGLTLRFRGFDLTKTTFLAWGSSSVSFPRLAFDGYVNAAGETLAFNAGASNLGGGILVWSGSAVFRYLTTSHSWAQQIIETRLTMAFTQSGVPVPLLDAATDPHGLPPAIGGAIQVTGDFDVTLLLEARVPPNPLVSGSVAPSGTFMPALDLFDRVHTDPLYDGDVLSSFEGGYYYLP